MEFTEAQQAEIDAIVSGALDAKMAPIEAKFDTERSNLQKIHGQWGDELGPVRTEFATAITSVKDLMQKTLDEKVPSMLEPYLKKDQVAPKTEETSAGIRKELEAQGKWEDVKKRVSELPADQRLALDSDDNLLVEFLKKFKGQPKGTSFFDDETSSGVKSPAEIAEEYFQMTIHKSPKGNANYQKNSTQSPSSHGMKTVGGGMRAERKSQ